MIFSIDKINLQANVELKEGSFKQCEHPTIQSFKGEFTVRLPLSPEVQKLIQGVLNEVGSRVDQSLVGLQQIGKEASPILGKLNISLDRNGTLSVCLFPNGVDKTPIFSLLDQRGIFKGTAVEAFKVLNSQLSQIPSSPQSANMPSAFQVPQRLFTTHVNQSLPIQFTPMQSKCLPSLPAPEWVVKLFKSDPHLKDEQKTKGRKEAIRKSEIIHDQVIAMILEKLEKERIEKKYRRDKRSIKRVSLKSFLKSNLSKDQFEADDYKDDNFL